MTGNKVTVVVVDVQSLSHVRLFVTPWTSACYAFLYFTISWSLLKFMCNESVKPSNHLILYHPFLSCPQSSPALGSFPMSQLFASGGQGRGASASASILPMNTQSWFLLGLTGLISLQSKGPPRAFSSTTVWKHQVIKLKYINVSISSNLENNDGPWHALKRERCNITLGCSYARVLSRSVVSDSLWPCGLEPTRLLCPWDSPGKNTGVGCHALLQGLFLTQGLKLRLLCLLYW